MSLQNQKGNDGSSSGNQLAIDFLSYRSLPQTGGDERFQAGIEDHCDRDDPQRFPVQVPPRKIPEQTKREIRSSRWII